MPNTDKEVNSKFIPGMDNETGSWQEAIRYTESLLEQNKRRTAELRVALRVFQEKLAAGEPWPRLPSS